MKQHKSMCTDDTLVFYPYRLQPIWAIWILAAFFGGAFIYILISSIREGQVNFDTFLALLPEGIAFLGCLFLISYMLKQSATEIRIDIQGISSNSKLKRHVYFVAWADVLEITFPWNGVYHWTNVMEVKYASGEQIKVVQIPLYLLDSDIDKEKIVKLIPSHLLK